MVAALSIDGFLDDSLWQFYKQLLQFKTFDSSMLCNSTCHVKALLVIWFLLFVLKIANYENRIVKFLKLVFSPSHGHHGYAPLPNTAYVAEDMGGPACKQRTFSYPDTLIYNYVDPDDIPELLRPYAESIFTLAQSIMQRHGFQVDNSRNQSEHLIMLLFNETSSLDKMVSSPALRIHKRMFENYRKWCDRMAVQPLLLKDVHPVKSHDMIIEDMLLFLLIWGEAANIRHMPECLCFLFHKTMEQHLLDKQQQHSIGGISSAGKYPGFYLDMVITPIYEVISKAMLSSADHSERKIYDDFNEFFWSSTCLRCRLHGVHIHGEDNIEVGMGPEDRFNENRNSKDLASAMKQSSKTYLEKRSWFHSLYSMNRIFEWHVITFSLLATWAFSNLLQWTYIFTLQVGSFIFWEITFFGIMWACLEIWTLYPTVKINDPTLFGFVLRICTGYLILCYQTVYFHWTFVVDSNTSLQDIPLYQKGDNVFWWWQYIWLSLFACSLYILQSVLCWIPSVGSAVLNVKNGLMQALIAVCYPFTQLYVGKDTSQPQHEVNNYIFFWITLMTFKLWFGYQYVVSPVAVPTLELYDDYMNYNKLSFVKTSMLIFFWWLPHFLVYIIDLSIWYSVWASLAGGIIAITDRLGAVRDSHTFRAHFMRAPRLFYNSFMPNVIAVEEAPKAKMKSHLSTVSLAEIVAEPRKDGGIELIRQSSVGVAASQVPGRKSKQLEEYTSYQQEGESYNSLGNDVELRQMNQKMGEKLGNFEKRNQEWTVFARIWNEVVKKLRERDLINNRELEILLFTSFDWLSKPTYLPLYQTAGCVEHAILAFKEASEEYDEEDDVQLKMKIVENYQANVGITAFEAVQESWELLVWVLMEILGPAHTPEATFIAATFTEWGNKLNIFGRFSGKSVKNMLSRATNIANAMKNGIKSRKNSPICTNETSSSQSVNVNSSSAGNAVVAIPESSGGMKKSLSTGFLSALNSTGDSPVSAEGNEMKDATGGGSKFPKMQPFRKHEGLVDNLRDKIRDELKALLNDVKSALQDGAINNTGPDLAAKITLLLKNANGFFVSDVYASKMIDAFAKDDRANRVLKKLVDLFQLRVTQVELKSMEANRRLNFFLNSIYMDVPKVPNMRYCREYTCITPYYSEDILLTPSDLQAVNSDNVSVILYLQTIYKNDWANFLERRNIVDETAIWSSSQVQELRMWASCRAQTLYRTVEGMMYTEAAIRLLAELENLSSSDTDLMSKLKFNYVVACQVYGVFKKTGDKKADDIEFLLSKYPNLRVAYIDAHKLNPSETAHYSVLIKCESVKSSIAPMRVNDPKSIKDRIKEVFRVKLPGNPVLGEGKPENQNHAIIFTRGRYLQAIDMNQDGYFEEALKMRNLLEEFHEDCAIVGFREHIFTGQVSSVANYMALQELSFVTLGQRVLNRPLRIRQHYGHPDLFDKLFVMTEGGMSKASRGINLSEDVFAGFNATIRGHAVHFIEYVQVGKGRDVGLQQTYKFEAKLSQGNAEQSLSRDLSRLGLRLDFFRLMSFYFGGIGHYLSNTLVMFTLVIVVYTMLALALYGEEGVNGRPMHPEGNFQLVLAGMGILQTLPLAVTLTVEKGFRRMLSELSFMMLSGGPLYFIFHIQTKCYYFSQTLLAGGAKYRPTGRGFVTRHSPFEENFRFFASSHIYFGFELMIALVIFGFYTTSKQYVGLTWSLWLAAASFLMGPFWFNPLSFEWNRISEDYNSWMRWMKERGGDSDQSWETWWREENSFYPKLSNTWKLFLVLQKCMVWILISVGIAGVKFFQKPDEQNILFQAVGVVLVYLLLKHFVGKFEREWTYPTRRFVSLLLSSTVAFVLFYLVMAHTKLLLYGLATYYFLAALCFLCLLFGLHSVVMPAYKLHDYLVGTFIFCLHTLACVIQVRFPFLSASMQCLYRLEFANFFFLFFL
jgi:callose synthase